MEMKKGKLLALACTHCPDVQGLIVGIREFTLLGGPSSLLVVGGDFVVCQGVAAVGLGGPGGGHCGCLWAPGRWKMRIIRLLWARIDPTLSSPTIPQRRQK